MYYVVLDLEWNQYHNPMWTPTSRNGVVMHEEIIQIGAVKLDKEFLPVDTFNVMVRLGGRRRLDKYVKKLTHISEEDLVTGEDFPVAEEMFAAWISDVDAVFSWGQDDMRVFLNNVAFHGLQAPSCAWFDAQKIYAMQKPQHGGLALKNIAEEEGIRVSLTLHDALNDAILTSVCMRSLDIEKGIHEYNKPRKVAEGAVAPFATAKTHRHTTKQGAWDEACAGLMHCPDCMRAIEWEEGEQGTIDRWYKTAVCPEHGKLIIRGEFQGTKAYTLKLSFFKYGDEVLEMIEKEFAPAKKKRRRKKSAAKAAKPAVTEPLSGEELLAKAISFAAQAHKDQQLSPGTAPYIVHPMEVVSILSGLTDDPALLAAGMLHDTLSMCPDVTSEKLESEFGAHVCELVEAHGDKAMNLSGNTEMKKFADAEEEELMLLLADTLSGLRAIAGAYKKAGSTFWDSMGAGAKKNMGAFYKSLTALFEPFNDKSAYEEYTRTVKALFGRAKL